MSARFVVLSGCSGGGKSALLAELARRGHAVVEEPGRRIVQAERAEGGTALPWIDLAAFARRAIALALADRAAAQGQPGWVFFDRGLVDAAAALEHATGEPALERLGRAHRYHGTVFLTPPWPELYATDAERRHSLADAIAEHQRLRRAYARLAYRSLELPRIGIAARADALLRALRDAPLPVPPAGSAGQS
ncbi:AAA family ATPase [Pseudoroseomonas cervicalis]|uniref:AAA family ATPase n=1 Tax=Teichococcus cervicalis TaxID=204525 RepID=UPI0022F19ECC|nr:AAA family ATPase [Pseudoroseomonas cervicalis]WBV41764.1 AAA family ATPase [Pseudoroseomonas cervicalis]